MRVVAVVLVRDRPDGSREVLAGQRSSPPTLAGLWEFPGGKVEPGEDDETALRREIREELAVEMVELRTLGDELPMTGIAPGMWQPFTARIAAGQPTPIDHAELRWLTEDQLDSMAWLTTDVPVLARVHALLAGDAPPRS